MTDHSVSEEEAASMISSDIVKHSVNAVREKTFHIKNATVHEDWKLGKGDRIPANVLFPDGTEAKKGSVIQTESFVIPAGSRFADGIDVCVTMSVGVASARLDQWPNNMPEFSSNMTGIIGDTISRAAEREKISKEEGRDRITPNMGHEASVPAHGLSPLRPYEAKPLIPLATIPVALAAPS